MQLWSQIERVDKVLIEVIFFGFFGLLISLEFKSKVII